MKKVMKKNSGIFTLLAAFILTFALGLCGLTNAGQSAYAQTTTCFDGVSVTLDENIRVNVNVTAPEGYTQAKILFSLGVGTEIVTADVTDGSAVLTTGLVTPQYMNEKLVAELTLSGEGKEDISEVNENFTLKAYLSSLLAESAAGLKQTETENALMRTLSVDLLNYGAEAQKYVAAKSGTPAGALANSDLTADQSALATDFETVAPQESDFSLGSGSTDVIDYKGAGLVFDYNVALYVNFVCDDLTGLTVKVTNDGNETIIDEFTKIDDYYSFVYDRISVVQFDNVLNIQAYKGETPVGRSLDYSVKSFVYSKKDSASVGALSRATYVYGYSAAAFKNADMTYPTQGEASDAVYKNNVEYPFMAVDANGNASRDATKGWYTPTEGSNTGLPVLAEENGTKYLQFNKTAQIELFFNKSATGKNYHIFDNAGPSVWGSEDAKSLFYKEYTYEFEVKSDGPFMLGLCDFGTDSGTFADGSKLYGITFLFDGTSVKMSRCGSGKTEAEATLKESVTDGLKKKISFAIVRESTSNGRMRLFVDGEKAIFEANEYYGMSEQISSNGVTEKGTIVNGTLLLPDARLYGQRFTVAPQTVGDGYSTVGIYSYAKRYVAFDYPEYTVTLVDGLTFTDGTTTKTITAYTDISSILDKSLYTGFYNTEDYSVFSGVVYGDVTLAGYNSEDGDIIPYLQQFSTSNSDGIKNDIRQSDVIVGGRRAKRYVYDKAFTKNYKIRFCNTLADGSKFLANTTYVSTFRIKNFSSVKLVFDLYEITSGHTLTDFATKVELAPGETGTYTIEWSFGASNNMLPFIVFNDQSDLSGFDFAMALNVVKK